MVSAEHRGGPADWSRWPRLGGSGRRPRDRPFVVAGYSMGGAVAQLVWRRHPARVVGLVLCATAATFAVSRGERVKAALLPAASVAARVAPSLGRRFVGQTLLSRFDGSPWRDWAVAEMARHHPATMLAHAAALGRFSSEPWIHEVDVPTAVIVPTGTGWCRPIASCVLPGHPGRRGRADRRRPRRLRDRAGRLRRRPARRLPAGDWLTQPARAASMARAASITASA